MIMWASKFYLSHSLVWHHVLVHGSTLAASHRTWAHLLPRSNSTGRHTRSHARSPCPSRSRHAGDSRPTATTRVAHPVPALGLHPHGHVGVHGSVGTHLSWVGPPWWAVGSTVVVHSPGSPLPLLSHGRTHRGHGARGKGARVVRGGGCRRIVAPRWHVTTAR